MAGEAPADARYRNAVSGYYVVNPATGIAVAGPFGRHGHAEIEARHRNAMYPGDAINLTVVGVGSVRT